MRGMTSGHTSHVTRASPINTRSMKSPNFRNKPSDNSTVRDAGWGVRNPRRQHSRQNMQPQIQNIAKHDHTPLLPVIESGLDQRVAIEQSGRRFNE